MKKTIILCTFILILSVAIPAALASASVTADKTSALPGETVSISGTAGADESVVVKITDEAGNIVFFDAAKVDASGAYEVDFVVPSDMEEGKLTVTAGSGNDVATTTINVISTASASATASPSASPAASATASPSTSATASAALSPSSTDEDKPADTTESTPAQNGEEGQAITPKEISQDEKTGIITIVIDIADLPDGTVAIQTPGGEILYVSDAQNGTLIIKVTKDDVDIDGNIEIVALGDEMTPLATVSVKVLDESGEIVIAKTGESGCSAWTIIVCIVVGAIILGLLILMLLKKRNKDAGNDTGSNE